MKEKMIALQSQCGLKRDETRRKEEKWKRNKEII